MSANELKAALEVIALLMLAVLVGYAMRTPRK